MADRDITTAFRDAVTAGVVRPATFVELEYDDSTLRFWDGVGQIGWDSKVWTGAGNLMGIDLAEETQEPEARNATFSLNGVSSAIISAALNHASEGRGRPARVWFGCLTLEAVAGAFSSAFSTAFDGPIEEVSVIQDPVRIFTGKMDVPAIHDDPASPSVSLTAEDDLIIMNRSRNRKYTHEDQQIDYPGDMFFDGLARQQDKPFVWGGG